MAGVEYAVVGVEFFLDFMHRLWVNSHLGS